MALMERLFGAVPKPREVAPASRQAIKLLLGTPPEAGCDT